MECLTCASENDTFSKKRTLLYSYRCVRIFEFQNGSRAVQPLGRNASRLVSRRNSHTQRGRTLLVRAADNDGSSEADARRLEELEARLGVNRKSRREGGGVQSPPPAPKPAAPAKAWDDMSLAEKAWQLYIGEEGALFWLNKAAYASIFIIIGGWIVFRFVGPALGWYELSSPLLPPEQVIAGTAGR